MKAKKEQATRRQVVLIRRALLIGAVVSLVLADATTASAQIAPDVAAAIGHDVRITLPGGKRQKGRLVDLTPTEAIVRTRDRRMLVDKHLSLANVTRIETAPHGTRNLTVVGGAVGLVIALSSDLCGSGRAYGNPGSPGEPQCITPVPILLMLGVAGIGATVGQVLDHHHRRLVYGTPASRPRTRIVPMVGAKNAAIRFSVDW